MNKGFIVLRCVAAVMLPSPLLQFYGECRHLLQKTKTKNLRSRQRFVLTDATHCLVAKLHFILYLCGYFSKLFASAKMEGFMADPFFSGAFCLKNDRI